MDAKITKNRLGNMFSYDWIKIAVLIVATIFAWTTLLSTIGTKPKAQQRMDFIFYNGITLSEDYYLYEEKYIASEKEKGVFSYEVMMASSLSMQADTRYGNIQFSAKLAAGERSILVVPDLVDKDAEKEGSTYLTEAVTSVYPILENMEEYFVQAQDYLNSFYHGDFANGELDESYLETQFRSRNTKDKRYKNEKQIAQGLKDEKERISSLRSSLLAVNEAISEGVMTPTSTYIEEEEKSVAYSLRIGTPRLQSIGKMYYILAEDGTTKSTESINVSFFTLDKESEQYMRFEKLNYLSYLLEFKDKI